MAISARKFFRNFVGYVFSAWKVVLFLFTMALLLCIAMFFGEANGGKNYSFPECIYLSLITALTIGYGDLSPTSFVGRFSAVLLGIIGIIFTGIIVAAAVAALPESEE